MIKLNDITKICEKWGQIDINLSIMKGCFELAHLSFEGMLCISLANGAYLKIRDYFIPLVVYRGFSGLIGILVEH